MHLRSCVVLLLAASALPAAEPLSFKMQEIERELGVGYAVVLVDVNGDKKTDIVVVDKTRILWYENPTWKQRIVVEGKTKPDNVCIAAADIDGDGKIDFAVGAGWGNLRSDAAGPIYWLQRGKTLDEQWTVHEIGAENSIHRMRFADLDGDGKPELVAVPLLGKGGTARGNWTDGAPVRTLAFNIPKDPVKERWTPEVVDETLHVIHNFWPIPADGRKGMDLLMASYDGVHRLSKADGKWAKTHLGVGNQDNPKSNRGASEIKLGHLASPGRKPGDSSPYIATIEPWHGNQVVVYTPPTGKGLWERQVIDDKLKWGHGVWCADLDGNGTDELIIGVRDDLSMNPGERRGVRVYKAMDKIPKKWERQIVDDGGIAVEDLSAADLDGDGKIDLVACGRQTRNVRIYWNGKK